jgi:c-di-GMP-binding flagellar brake protein YcgR
MKRSQRREYYRLECLFDVRFRLVSEYEKILRARMLKHDFAEEEAYNDASDELAAMRSQWEEGLASDISGGGMCLHGRVSYDPDDELELELLLPMDNKIVHTEVMLRVVRCADKEENRFRYEIRGEFIDLDNSKRELIVRYVFQEQRKRLGKL